MLKQINHKYIVVENGDFGTGNRVIPFGGSRNTMEDVLRAEETRPGGYIGIHAVKSRSYEHNYHCMRLE